MVTLTPIAWISPTPGLHHPKRVCRSRSRLHLTVSSQAPIRKIQLAQAVVLLAHVLNPDDCLRERVFRSVQEGHYSTGGTSDELATLLHARKLARAGTQSKQGPVYNCQRLPVNPFLASSKSNMTALVTTAAPIAENATGLRLMEAPDTSQHTAVR